MATNFFPFAKALEICNHSLLVLGGLDDTVPNKPMFSSRTLECAELPITNYESAVIG